MQSLNNEKDYLKSQIKLCNLLFNGFCLARGFQVQTKCYMYFLNLLWSTGKQIWWITSEKLTSTENHPQQLPLGFFSLSFTESGPFLELLPAVGTDVSGCHSEWGFSGAWESWRWKAPRPSSEGCKSSPLGVSPVSNGIVESKWEGWAGRRGVKWRVRRMKWSTEKSVWWTCVMHSCCLGACRKCLRL